MFMKACISTTVAVLLFGSALYSQEHSADASADRLSADTFSGLQLRSIGPAVMSGRISDIAVDPSDRSTWFVAVASGAVWKTVNAGTTWQPVFDKYGSYSIGCVTIDPKNPNIVWVGTGENNSQRSVGWGDGVYKSEDGGKTWKNMGLKSSEHIARIVLDPRDSNVVYVASQGPLWAPGGERGLFRSKDAGKTWESILEVSENTGISDVVIHPKDPQVLVAASYQRRRHVGILVAGGPESGIYKSTDGGETWKEITSGIPRVDKGRIGLAISPIDPDVMYATIPASRDQSGFFRSEDRGESWRKMSDYIPADPQYYQELYPDPHRFDRVYTADIMMHVTDDGGLTFQQVNSEFKHVDNHALVFDPEDPEYLMVGCDGGLYESWDRAKTWKYVSNLPVTQFYRVGLDNNVPFYNVYGGTQDNATQGGPSRTTNVHGIRNSDWINTVGGDGFQARVDPEDPNIIYSMSQYAGIVRYDKRSGERVDIQPQPDQGDPPLRWHWDAPLIISPHSHTRLYFAANRLFRSEDRGDSWDPISPDLSRQIDRNSLPVMGRVWSVDAVWKNVFTSPYGTIVSLDESPLVEGLIYAGTDDGVIQVTEDGGASWRKVEAFPGVPEYSYAADVAASRHNADRIFAVFNNHKQGDFAPYLLVSNDRGRNWQSITGDLPEGQASWTLVEDHVNPNLLFCGTEFGLFFTLDGGSRWIPLKGDVPTIPFRDLEIQRRENDLVGATFGRGFLILDDYSPLQQIDAGRLEQEALLFPVKDAWLYIQDSPLGGREKGQQGHAYFTAPNPPFGAVFTYYLKEGAKTLRQQRWAEEDRLKKDGQSVEYPSWDELREEERQEQPEVVFTVADESGRKIRRITGPALKGFHRVAWDLRYYSLSPLGSPQERRRRSDAGPLVLPGRYSVEMSLSEGGASRVLGSQTFEVVSLGSASLPAEDKVALLEFQQELSALQSAVLAVRMILDERLSQLEMLREAVETNPQVDTRLRTEALQLANQLRDLKMALEGDETITSRAELATPSVIDRLGRAAGALWSSTSRPTASHRKNYSIAEEEFTRILSQLRGITEGPLQSLYGELDAQGARWTPGRDLPQWPPER